MTNSKRSAAKAEADDLKAKMRAAPLQTKLSSAMSQALPPPPVIEQAAVTSPLPIVPPAPGPAASTRSRLTTIGVPEDELADMDDFVTWLRQQSGVRNIGASTLVRCLLRCAKRDDETVQALRAVIALDGRRRR